VTSVLAEPSKVVQKRSGLGHYGAPALGHGYGLGLGHGLGLGPGIPSGYALGGIGLGHGTVVGADVHTTVTKHIGVPVPAPYPVAVDRPVPYPVKVSFPLLDGLDL
jgi:hypothetical protein